MPTTFTASQGKYWLHPGDRKSTRLNSSHTEIYTLSLHDALPILEVYGLSGPVDLLARVVARDADDLYRIAGQILATPGRSEERRVGKECRSRCDWSSDVCSSDLGGVRAERSGGPARARGCPRCRRPLPHRRANTGYTREIGRASCRERV